MLWKLHLHRKKKRLDELLLSNADSKVDEILAIYKESKVDQWAKQLKEKHLQEAFNHLDSTSVDQQQKEPLRKLAHFLIDREH